MARKAFTEIPSDKVQGEGTWIRIKQLTVAQYTARMDKMSKAQQALKDNDAEIIKALTAELLVDVADMLLEWNWTDEENNPLPQPHKNPDVFQMLTMDEMDFVNECVDPYSALQKKAGMLLLSKS